LLEKDLLQRLADGLGEGDVPHDSAAEEWVDLARAIEELRWQDDVLRGVFLLERSDRRHADDEAHAERRQQRTCVDRVPRQHLVEGVPQVGRPPARERPAGVKRGDARSVGQSVPERRLPVESHDRRTAPGPYEPRAGRRTRRNGLCASRLR